VSGWRSCGRSLTVEPLPCAGDLRASRCRCA